MDLIVKGVRPYDGTYPLDGEVLRGEWRWVKRLTGYMPATLQEGLDGGDPDVSGALAIVAMLRAGKITEDEIPAVWERLSASAIDSVDVAGDEESESEQEDEDDPPATGPEENTSSSGPDTPTSSATSPQIPLETGDPSSGSSELALVRSGR